MSTTMPQVDSGSPGSALEVLRGDHQQIGHLLNQYDLIKRNSDSSADRQGLIARMGALINALHGVKEQIIYPLLKEVAPHGLLKSVQEDHRLLCQQLQLVAAKGAKDQAVDTEVEKLAGLLRAYFAMEEKKLFPLLINFDSPELGQQVAVHRSMELGDQGAD